MKSALASSWTGPHSANQEFRPTRDIFRGMPGVRLKVDGRGRTYLASSRGNCAMQVYLDGIPIYRPDNPVQGPPPAIDE